MAIRGELPLKTCPVIIPGNATRPIVAMDAKVGLADLFKASLKNGNKASFYEAFSKIGFNVAPLLGKRLIFFDRFLVEMFWQEFFFNDS